MGMVMGVVYFEKAVIFSYKGEGILVYPTTARALTINYEVLYLFQE